MQKVKTLFLVGPKYSSSVPKYSKPLGPGTEDTGFDLNALAGCMVFVKLERTLSYRTV